MTKAQRLAQCLGPDCSVIEVTYQGLKYAVTQGTGETSYGAELGGQCSYAYAVSDLTADTLRPDQYDYSAWCNDVSPVEDFGLAKMMARRHGLRLTRSGSCQPVLTDDQFTASIR